MMKRRMTRAHAYDRLRMTRNHVILSLSKDGLSNDGLDLFDVFGEAFVLFFGLGHGQVDKGVCFSR